MSRNWPLPPCEAVCLVRLRSSTQKGGTLIAEDVRDRAAHERRICHPDGYRPAACPRCGGRQLHVHDYRERILRAEPDDPVVTTVRHACVGCHAIWQILPAFVARCLWRSWQVVADALDPAATPWTAPPVPRRTVRRWRARLARPATYLCQVLAASGAAAWAMLVSRLRSDDACAALVSAYAGDAPGANPFAALGALVYRLHPRVRLL